MYSAISRRQLTYFGSKIAVIYGGLTQGKEGVRIVGVGHSYGRVSARNLPI